MVLNSKTVLKNMTQLFQKSDKRYFLKYIPKYISIYLGYYLKMKKLDEAWTEISLDYDLMSYTMENLPCGTTFSFNLVSHNVAGM